MALLTFLRLLGKGYPTLYVVLVVVSSVGFVDWWEEPVDIALVFMWLKETFRTLCPEQVCDPAV